MKNKAMKKDNEQQYTFQLIGNNQTYFDKITVDFQPQRHNSSSSSSSQQSYSSSSSESQKYCSIVPRYNNDRKIYTPSFYIPYDIQSQSYYQEKHYRRINKYDEISYDKIMVAKPRKKDYCHVCQKYFDDYLEHINSRKHSKRIHKNPFHKHIKRLIDKFCVQTQRKQERLYKKQEYKAKSRIIYEQI